MNDGAPRLGEHALVIGASMAGLCAAGALADSYERVTVIDRDELPEGFEGRRGVPQGTQVHGLTVGGTEALEELLPGIRGELVAAGAPTFSPNADFRFTTDGHTIAPATVGATSVLCTRPFLEGHVRRRVAALHNVELRANCEALGLTADATGKRVCGARVREPGGEETIEAGLVIAATGRSARLPAWLEELGYGRPREESLDIHLTYATRRYRLAPDAIEERAIIEAPRPDLARGFAMFAQEDGAWMVTVASFGEEKKAPTEPAAFDAFLQTVAPAHALEALAGAEPFGEIVRFGYKTERRRRYERMRRFPESLLPIGDAICSFDPIYGQGMTVAALEALALRRCLQGGGRNLRRRYLRAASRIVAHAWSIATAADFTLPGLRERANLAVRLQNAYVERLERAATADGEAAAALIRVVSMTASPLSVARPSLLWRALRGPSPKSPPWPARHLQSPVRRPALQVDGIATVLREAGPSDAPEAVVFIHGVPGSGADFEPLLASAGRLGRAIAWDAPGFGRADKPAAFEQSVAGHGAFIAGALEELGVERAHLVLHDFGGGWGLRFAADNPERVASVSLLCAGAPIEYRWHRVARIWRSRPAGELMMASTTPASFRAGMRRAGPRRLPRPFLERMYEDFDRETRAAILRLYRSVPDIAAAGRELADALAPARIPALVVWGEQDPYLPPALAARQRDAFPEAEVHVLPNSGHFPFVDQADQVEQLLLAFLEPRLRVTLAAAER